MMAVADSNERVFTLILLSSPDWLTGIPQSKAVQCLQYRRFSPASVLVSVLKHTEQASGPQPLYYPGRCFPDLLPAHVESLA